MTRRSTITRSSTSDSTRVVTAPTRALRHFRPARSAWCRTRPLGSRARIDCDSRTGQPRSRGTRGWRWHPGCSSWPHEEAQHAQVTPPDQRLARPGGRRLYRVPVFGGCRVRRRDGCRSRRGHRHVHLQARGGDRRGRAETVISRRRTVYPTATAPTRALRRFRAPVGEKRGPTPAGRNGPGSAVRAPPSGMALTAATGASASITRVRRARRGTTSASGPCPSPRWLRGRAPERDHQARDGTHR